MNKSKWYNKWIFTFGAIGALIGALIAQFLKGGFDLAGFLGTLTAVLLIITIDIIRNWRKKDKTPDFDERTVNNILKFYAYASNGFIMLALLLFSILSFSGVETIPVLYVLVGLFIYFSLSGATAFIISRR